MIIQVNEGMATFTFSTRNQANNVALALVSLETDDFSWHQDEPGCLGRDDIPVPDSVIEQAKKQLHDSISVI